jgi:hypothetical protein
VPDAVVVVSVLIVIVPLPIPTAACHPAAGLPIRISAFALLSGPSVYVPVPAAVGVTAKLRVVARDASVPDTDRMPLAKLPATELAVVAVPSTRNVIDDADGLLDPLELPGAVGLLPLPPPHPIVAAARPSAHTHRGIRIVRPLQYWGDRRSGLYLHVLYVIQQKTRHSYLSA